MSNATNNQASTGQDVSLSADINVDTLNYQLSFFTGTVNWYRHSIQRDVMFTDGVKFFAEAACAWWFVDDSIIEYAPLMRQHGFLTITLNVSDTKAKITVDDGNDNVLATREIPFTDCPVGQYRFYFTDNVLLLPSEY